jgi:alkanesulfonate monooxygenase
VLPVRLFCTVPQSSDFESGGEFIERVGTVSRWCEQAGFEGILIYASNRFVDPWMVAQRMLESTERLSPFVAVQPISMHPYTVAKMVTSLGFAYGRRLYLNMIAGGFKNELQALGDDTPHDERYDRLIEYTEVFTRLLATHGPVHYDGRYYKIDGVSLAPELPAELLPGICVSGSSGAGMAAAKRLDATAIEVPRSSGDFDTPGELRDEAGIRIGIVARENDDEAWALAFRRFPEDRRGEIIQKMADKTSDGKWYNQITANDEDEGGPGKSPYWLRPFRTFKSFVPYLVGGHEQVSEALARYMRAGFKMYVIDMPAEEEDVVNAGAVFRQAAAKAGL